MVDEKLPTVEPDVEKLSDSVVESRAVDSFCVDIDVVSVSCVVLL